MIALSFMQFFGGLAIILLVGFVGGSIASSWLLLRGKK